MGHKPHPVMRLEEKEAQKTINQMAPMVYKPKPLDQHDITTKRLISLYISKMMEVASWTPNVDSVWKCYEYINDAVLCKIEDSPCKAFAHGIDTEYAEYFLNEDPDHIKSIIGQEMELLSTLREVHR